MADDRGPSVRWLTGTAWASLLIFALTSSLVSVPLEEIGQDLDIGFAAKGLLASARSCALATSCFLCGYWADRLGKRWFLGGGLCVVALGLVWAGLSHTYVSLMLGLMAVGAGLGPLEGLTSPLVADLHPQNVPTQMNILHSFFSGGLAVTSVFLGGALVSGVAWRKPFLVTAAPAFIVAVMYVTGRYPDAEASARPEPLRVRDILRSGGFWPLAAAMALTAGCEGSLIYWSANFIQAEYRESALVGAYGLAVCSAAMAAGRVVTGVAARFVPISRLMVGSAFVGAAAALCLALIPDLWVSMAAFVVAGLCVGCFWPSILSVAIGGMAVGSATLLAMLSVAGIAGFGAIPTLVGVTAEWAGLRAGFVLVPVALLAAGVVLMAVSGRLQPLRPATKAM